MYPAPKQLDTRVRELIEEVAEIQLYLDSIEERDARPDTEPPQLNC